MKVLMIDDDAELADAMRPVLGQYSVDLASALTPDDGLAMLSDGDFDALLLDMMLPGRDGLTVCREIREGDATVRGVPIIALTARASLTDRVVGLESGVDDYVSKPFDTRELVARLHAVQRRFRRQPEIEQAQPSHPEGELVFLLLDDQLTVNERELRASLNETVLDFSEVEFRFLVELCKSIGSVVSREELLERLHYDKMTEPRVADVIIYRIRNKLKRAGAKNEFIRTVRGRGYSWVGEKAR